MDSQYKDLDASRALVSLGFKSIYRESDTTNILPDGDMEAVGVGAWTPLRADLSKVASALPGSSQALRIACNSAPGSAHATQAVLVSGKTYRARGWARYVSGPAGSQPAFSAWTVYVWTGVMTHTDWQYFDVTFTATHANCGCATFAGGVGSIVEFDNVSVVAELSKTPNIGSLGGGALLGADGFTPASQPSPMPGVGMKFDGSDDYVQMQHNGELAFRGAGVDLPFSVEILTSLQSDAAAGYGIAHRGIVISGGWGLYASAALVMYISDSAGNYFGKAIPGPFDYFTQSNRVHIIAAYTGSGLASGVDLFVNGQLPAQNPVTSGVYTGQPANTDPVIIGRTRVTAGITYMSKQVPASVFNVWPFALTRGQAKFRAARALAEMRVR